MLTNLQTFLEFTQSAVGLLLGINVVFPMAGSLIGVAPIPKEIRAQVSVLSSISCIFTLFFIFELHFRDRLGTLSVGVALFAFALYIYFGLFRLSQMLGGADNGHVALMMYYVIASICLTGAFNILLAGEFWCERLGC